jgi:hypothetical protein
MEVSHLHASADLPRGKSPRRISLRRQDGLRNRSGHLRRKGKSLDTAGNRTATTLSSSLYPSHHIHCAIPNFMLLIRNIYVRSCVTACFFLLQSNQIFAYRKATFFVITHKIPYLVLVICDKHRLAQITHLEEGAVDMCWHVKGRCKHFRTVGSSSASTKMAFRYTLVKLKQTPLTLRHIL